MKKKIGILGVISAASTTQYYKGITDLYNDRYQNYYYTEIIIYSLDFQYFTDLENEYRMEEYMDYILKGVHTLKKAGADIVIMAANSPHSVFDEIRQRALIPMISIVEATAVRASEQKIKKVLLTGIKYTMQSNFYQNTFKKYEIEVLTPTEEHQNEINSIIFNELAIRHFSSHSRDRLVHIIDSYDVDSVILGCTELPLILSNEHCNIPVLDTLSIHIHAILNYAIK
ncbi:amino acid racemase [Gracilibacillus caseinilyticus]|uniref:Amino acid racemase n=1 Tax=Gracilibacillus caseinilyticus TaxID=2932256 RepID=A0ABY4EY42_9BACI|nr:amino acid racemase [Gracilibacillus caseinilyticus]UOQ49328.1 amino acid racemase [Gracilibacillus caseinilyticus]